MVRLLRELRVAVRCLLVVATHPFSLLYPLALSVIAIAMTAGTLGYVFAAFADAVYSNVVLIGLALAAYFLLLPFAIVFLLVAYSYEVHELYRGRRPAPGAGLAVAARRVRTIGLATVVITAAFNAGQFARGGGLIGEVLGSLTSASSRVLSTFVYPAIAVREGGPRDVIEGCEQAVRERWGGALVTSVGLQSLGSVFAFLGLAGGVGLVVGWWLDRLPFEAGLEQVLALAVGSFFGGLFLAVLVVTTAMGPISTALYLYATEERVPEKLALDHDDLVDMG